MKLNLIQIEYWYQEISKQRIQCLGLQFLQMTLDVLMQVLVAFHPLIRLFHAFLHKKKKSSEILRLKI